MALLSLQAALLAYSALVHSPTFNEIGHLPAAICHWRYGDYSLYRVNPPLARMVAALPVLALDPHTPWPDHRLDAGARSEIPTGIAFAKANGGDTFRLFAVARLACIPFALLGGWVCYLWARDLWGGIGGLLACGLWTVSPWILGHGPLVMPDVPAAAIGVAACYLFRGWCARPTWERAVAVGAALGAAELTKSTLLVLYPLFVVAWAARLLFANSGDPRRWRHEAAMLLAQFLLSLLALNAGYGLAGSFRPLGDYHFQSRLLAAMQDAIPGLAQVPAPLPADYLIGIDRQRRDFELGARSYLRGEWRERGWAHYYLYGLAVKTPLGTLALLAASVVLSAFRWFRASLWDELFLLLCGGAIVGLVSSQTGFAMHVRYVLPALPFAFVYAGRCGRLIELALACRTGRGPARFHGRRVIWGAAGATAVLGCILWAAASSLAVYPHSLGYFNTAAGGPAAGGEHLLESNSAWGQDLLFLKRWLDEHPEARPIALAAYGWVDPRLAGIEFKPPPVGPSSPANLTSADPSKPHARRRVPEELAELGPLPGWYAVDLNFLYGAHWPVATGDGRWQSVPTEGLNYEYFRRFKPVASAGYSIKIYHVSPTEANRARRELGLPLLNSHSLPQPPPWDSRRETGPPVGESPTQPGSP